jgi:hypothetical protein
VCGEFRLAYQSAQPQNRRALIRFVGQAVTKLQGVVANICNAMLMGLVKMFSTPKRVGFSRSRVSDIVYRAFDHACIMQDLETAAELLMVLEAMAKRKLARFGGDRREGQIDLAAADTRLRSLKDYSGRN